MHNKYMLLMNMFRVSVAVIFLLISVLIYRGFINSYEAKHNIQPKVVVKHVVANSNAMVADFNEVLKMLK